VCYQVSYHSRQLEVNSNREHSGEHLPWSYSIWDSREFIFTGVPISHWLRATLQRFSVLNPSWLSASAKNIFCPRITLRKKLAMKIGHQTRMKRKGIGRRMYLKHWLFLLPLPSCYFQINLLSVHICLKKLLQTK
jgi:hypothetical protein